jgi:hypothetical protein
LQVQADAPANCHDEACHLMYPSLYRRSHCVFLVCLKK